MEWVLELKNTRVACPIQWHLPLKQVLVSSCSFLGLLLAFVRCLTFELDEVARMASLHAFYMEGNVSQLLCMFALLILPLCWRSLFATPIWFPSFFYELFPSSHHWSFLERVVAELRIHLVLPCLAIFCWPNSQKNCGHRKIARHSKFFWEWIFDCLFPDFATCSCTFAWIII